MYARKDNPPPDQSWRRWVAVQFRACSAYHLQWPTVRWNCSGDKLHLLLTKRSYTAGSWATIKNTYQQRNHHLGLGMESQGGCRNVQQLLSKSYWVCGSLGTPETHWFPWSRWDYQFHIQFWICFFITHSISHFNTLMSFFVICVILIK